MKTFLKKHYPILISILVFVLLSVIYVKPVLEGKTIKQGDIVNHKGMAREIVDYRESTGEEALWTNNMFGGMPAYQISTIPKTNVAKYIKDIVSLGLPHPASTIFLYFLGFFILIMVITRNNIWLSVLGAIAFCFSSYFFIILEAGHNTKALAIAFMAPILAGVILTYRGKYLWGMILTSIAIALEFYANHVQMTYYLFMSIFVYAAIVLIQSIKEKKIKHYLKASGLIILALILGITVNTSKLLTTYEYTEVSTRGSSELTFNEENKTKGLDRDYATQWSYGIGESFSLMIPNVKGGASNSIIPRPGGKKEWNKHEWKLKKIDPQFKEQVANSNQYWGEQPFTSGPVYAGAIIVFLFILGLFYIKGKYRWFVLISLAFSLMLSWGRHFPGLTNFFLDYIPMYNKFRAVSSILVIAELVIPILAIIVLWKITEKPALYRDKASQRKLYIAFGLTGGISLLFYLMPSTFFNFITDADYAAFDQWRQSAKSPEELQQINQYVESLLPQIEIARITIFKADALRSFTYILLGAALIWVYIKKAFNKQILFAILAVLIIADMWTVNKRYLNDDNFVAKREMKTPFQISAADQFILNNNPQKSRVLNLTVNPFSDASTSYFHNSIGGYHAAKLERYQELIDYHISPEIQRISATFNNNPTDSSINACFSGLSVLNMLDMQFLIYSREAQPLYNQHALGKAWFVEEIQFVPTADDEIMALTGLDTENKAVIRDNYKKYLENFVPQKDSLADIIQVEYKPNYIKYQAKTNNASLAVFSEIYYNKGWKAYINGEEVPIIKANYTLRALQIPAGESTIEFKFRPKSYYLGERIAFVSSLLLVLLFFFGLYWSFFRKPKAKLSEDEKAI